MDILILLVIDIAIFWLIYRNLTKRPKIVPQRFIRTPPTKIVYSGGLLEAIKAADIQRLYESTPPQSQDPPTDEDFREFLKFLHRLSDEQKLARNPISLN